MKYNKQQIIEDYLSGINTKIIANKLGTYNTTIRRILIRNNINLRNQSESLSNLKNLFADHTPESDYWLGMLISDGYIGDKEYVVGLGLQEKDNDHVDKYSKFIGVPQKRYLHNKYKVFQHRVYFKNKAINLWLRSIGITPRKSATIELKIPLNFNILRGIIDGDGYIRKDKPLVEIATQSELLREQIITFLKQNGIHCTWHISSSVFVIGIYKLQSVKLLYNYLYIDATVFLERKKNNLQKTLNL